jgi:type I restriction enzyme S subunit
MNTEQLLAHYERIADAPDAVPRLRQFILDLAVRGKLVPQDASDEPAAELLKRIAAEKARLVKSSKGRGSTKAASLDNETVPFLVPSSWLWTLFGDVVISRDGERVPVSKEERSRRAKVYDYYGASGIIDKIDDYLFDKPLLLIGEDGANLINRSTPIAFIARGKYWVNNHAHVLDGISEGLLRYLELFINAIDLKPYITGTAQPKMNQAKMNSIPVALPPLAEQRRIVARVDELMALCDRLEASLSASEHTRRRLLDALLHAALAPAEEPVGA